MRYRARLNIIRLGDGYAGGTDGVGRAIALATRAADTKVTLADLCWSQVVKTASGENGGERVIFSLFPPDSYRVKNQIDEKVQLLLRLRPYLIRAGEAVSYCRIAPPISPAEKPGSTGTTPPPI
jgi:hypothetical protein